MKNHTRIYLNYFNFKIPEDCFCEIPDCGIYANDINHIDARGMGGDPNGSKDVIENLMATCRNHHNQYGDVPDKKEWLREVHMNFISNRNSGPPVAEFINNK